MIYLVVVFVVIAVGWYLAAKKLGGNDIPPREVKPWDYGSDGPSPF